jgi:hypothetical protein
MFKRNFRSALMLTLTANYAVLSITVANGQPFGLLP